MTENLYAPPVAAVADQTPVSATAAPVFFAVSPLKLVVLSFATLGLYQYYWIYKNWKLHQLRTGENISPFPRAFFALFFIYQLFKRMDEQAKAWNSRRIAAGPLATFWILVSLLWKLPDPYWLVIYVAIFALVPVQQAVNELNLSAAPGHDQNSHFSAWNWVAVIVGLPFFALGALGAFLPEA